MVDYKKVKTVFLFVLSLLISIDIAFADPSITSLSSSTIYHGGALVLYDSGSGFGTKSPAAPLIWDDGENASADAYVTTSSPGNSESRVSYSQIEPPATVSDTHRMTYRSTPYTPTGTGALTAVASPHSHGSKIISFGHENGIGGDGNDGANGWLTIPNTNGAGSYASEWTIMYYYRFVAEWPACGTQTNNKFFVLNDNLSVWGTDSNFHYWDFNKKLPCAVEDYARITPMTAGAVIVDDDGSPPLTLPDSTSPWGKDQTINAAIIDAPYDPQDGWQKFEIRITNSSIRFLIDNKNGWWGTNIENWMVSTGIGQNGAGSVSLGGYYYKSTSPNIEDDNAHRMLDDVYVDDTLSHVVLANNQTYDSATIVEPQIPSAWATGEITVKVNQGAIPDGTAYLFVFDADGDHNATGYSVTLGEESASTSTTQCSGSFTMH